MADIRKLYETSLDKLGIKDELVHSTRLRENCWLEFRTSSVLCRDGNTSSCSTRTLGLLWETTRSDSDAIHVAKAAQIIRRELVDVSNTFKGNFESNRQDDSVPHLLKYMVSMIVNGLQPSTKTSKNLQQSQVVLTISQMLVFNTKKEGNNIKSSAPQLRERHTFADLYQFEGAFRDGEEGFSWNFVLGLESRTSEFSSLFLLT